jgi:hypothetical protein
MDQLTLLVINYIGKICSFALGEENTLKVHQNKIMTKILRYNTKKIRGEGKQCEFNSSRISDSLLKSYPKTTF